MKLQSLRALSIAFAALALGASAFAQGSDNCATAQVIAGTGSFAYNTVTASTGAQGQAESLCDAFSTTAVSKDVWYSWTAPSNGFATVSMCAGAANDTKIAAYPGSGCPAGGTALACNDDSCGFQSVIGFNVTAGASYTLQIGCFPGDPGGSGTFSLTIGPPPPSYPPCTSTGPDVIVGDLPDVLNATNVGGIDALAIGTYSCNIGNQVLNWIAGNNHPVIAQNLYRFKLVNGANRFEQVGMSWLKHGFTALQDPLCCPTCTANPNGNALGVGCADPYGAGLNGSQGGLGPHWQVNANTGVFTYPPANPAWSGSVARRLQVKATELEVTGGAGAARYFGEGQYVARDDAVAGNQNNNASWREVTITGGPSDFTFALQGFTFPAQSAIQAWPQIESGVTMNNVQIPSEGKLIVGSKATNLGGGQWHYEFAVYNMNSDRNVGSFSVPVPPGVTVTNIGFHDVDYHSGDGISNVNVTGTDWVGSVSGGAITWACETQAANNNANAIRWGTTFNFRFDANTPPQTGQLTLGLWKPGTPTSVTTSGDVPTPNTFLNYCFGDGTNGACPCSNNGAAGNGCANSGFVSGASLNATGTPSVTGDTVFLNAANMTGSIAVFFQGATQTAPTVIDDGLGCVGGPIIRLGNKPAAGTSSFPQGGDPLISVRGAIPPAGGTYYYQCFYRNAVAVFCPPATSNRTNGVQITWAP